jgi:hypothetical protein
MEFKKECEEICLKIDKTEKSWNKEVDESKET